MSYGTVDSRAPASTSRASNISHSTGDRFMYLDSAPCMNSRKGPDGWARDQRAHRLCNAGTSPSPSRARNRRNSAATAAGATDEDAGAGGIGARATQQKKNTTCALNPNG